LEVKRSEEAYSCAAQEDAPDVVVTGAAAAEVLSAATGPKDKARRARVTKGRIVKNLRKRNLGDLRISIDIICGRSTRRKRGER
jgi:hypothetical protein